MTLTLDTHEGLLAEALRPLMREHWTKPLPVGDVHCKYADDTEWILERIFAVSVCLPLSPELAPSMSVCTALPRKTVSDLAQSIRSGRWNEQLSRLYDAGYQLYFFLIEGDLRDENLGLPYNALMSAMVNVSLRPKSHVLRTMDVQESAKVVDLLVEKGGACPSIPSGLAPPKPLTKRKRDADRLTIFKRQLMVVPSISENIAAKLCDHFEGSIPNLQKALGAKKFPKVRLDDRKCIGPGRVKKLATHFL